MYARLLLALAVTLAACTVGVRKARHDKLQYDDPPARTASAAPSEQPSAGPTGSVDTSATGAKICTKIGCQDRYALTVATRDDSSAKIGVYELLIVAEGKRSTCKITVTKDGATRACEGGARAAPVDESLPRSVLGVIEIDGAPAAVEVTVKRGGATLTKSSLTPSYKTSQPNGPDCSPTCKHADERLTF